MKECLIRCQKEPFSIRVLKTYLKKKKGKGYEIKPLSAKVYSGDSEFKTLIFEFPLGEKWVCNRNIDLHTFDFVCVNRDSATQKNRIIEVLDLVDLPKLDKEEV